MKWWTTALTAGLLSVILVGCGGAKQAFEPARTARAMLETPGVFTEELEALDRAVIDGLYGLEGSGAVEAVCWYSPGGTAEEVTVLRFGTKDEAKAFEAQALEHIADAKESNVSYRPQEMPKLDKAVVERRGDTLLILVSADYDAAQAALDALS